MGLPHSKTRSRKRIQTQKRLGHSVDKWFYFFGITWQAERKIKQIKNNR